VFATPGNLLEFEIAFGNTGNLLECFLVSNVIFTRPAIFSAMYMGKSSGKWDRYDLRGYCVTCHVKKSSVIFKNMYSANLLEIG